MKDKLLKLKKWLTVADAARHLSIIFGEEVTDAGVLRLALDGHLRLSVHFVNYAKAKCGKVVPWEETDWVLLPNSGKQVTKPVDQQRAKKSRPLPPKLGA